MERQGQKENFENIFCVYFVFIYTSYIWVMQKLLLLAIVDAERHSSLFPHYIFFPKEKQHFVG